MWIGKKIAAILLLGCVLLTYKYSAAQSGITVPSDTSRITLENHFDIFKDTIGNLSFDQVRTGDDHFNPYHGVLNFSKKPNVYWIRFSITNNFAKSAEFVLSLNDVWDKIELYCQVGDSFEYEITGSTIPLNQRTMRSQFSGVNLLLNPGAKQIFYGRFLFDGDYNTPDDFIDKVVRREIFVRDEETDRYVQGIFLGMIIIMSFYNLFIYFAIRDKNYLYYVLMLFGMGVIFMANVNYSFEYLWPKHPGWQVFIDNVPVLGAFEGFWLLVFFQSFLKTRERLPVWHKIMNVVNVLSLLTVPIGVFHILPHCSSISNILGIVIFTIGPIIGIISYRRGYKPARFFLLGTVFSARGTILFLLQDMLHFLPFDIKQYPMQFGYTVDMVFFSLAIADRISLQNRGSLPQKKYFWSRMMKKKFSDEVN